MIMCIQNLVLFCQFVLKILSKNRILTSIKGSNSVANLQKTKIYNTNKMKTLSKNQNLTSIKGRNSFANLRKTMIYTTDVDLVNDNEYTKFSLILSIRSQVIE